MKPVNQANTYGNKGNPENDGKQDTYQQGPPRINFGHFKKGEYQNKYEDIVDTQAPLHQVGRNIFKGYIGVFFPPQKGEKNQGKAYPENGLFGRGFDGNGLIFFGQKAKIKNKR
jgi:hypothetical protein